MLFTSLDDRPTGFPRDAATSSTSVALKIERRRRAIGVGLRRAKISTRAFFELRFEAAAGNRVRVDFVAVRQQRRERASGRASERSAVPRYVPHRATH